MSRLEFRIVCFIEVPETPFTDRAPRTRGSLHFEASSSEARFRVSTSASAFVDLGRADPHFPPCSFSARESGACSAWYRGWVRTPSPLHGFRHAKLPADASPANFEGASLRRNCRSVALISSRIALSSVGRGNCAAREHFTVRAFLTDMNVLIGRLSDTRRGMPAALSLARWRCALSLGDGEQVLRSSAVCQQVEPRLPAADAGDRASARRLSQRCRISSSARTSRLVLQRVSRSYEAGTALPGSPALKGFQRPPQRRIHFPLRDALAERLRVFRACAGAPAPPRRSGANCRRSVGPAVQRDSPPRTDGAVDICVVPPPHAAMM